MKIVYCIKNITNGGGSERVVSNKANYLTREGYDVSIISVESTPNQPFFHFDSRIKFYSLGCDSIYKFKHRKTLKWFDIKRYKKPFLKRLKPILEEIKPDITISLFDEYTPYTYMVNDGSKKILEFHFAKHKNAQYLAKLEKNAMGRLITHYYRRKIYNITSHFDKFVVLTEEDKKAWGNLKNIITIPNALTFIPEIHSDLQAKRIVAMGRFTRQKQFDILIKIWSKIADKYPDWKLSIFGNGDAKKFTDLAEELGVSQSVEILAATKDVEGEFCKSSIYALTSKYEGFGMVLVEAMSCGLPVVSFSCKSGPSDIIRNGEDGFLIPPGNTDLFAEKLSLLIEDYELRHKMGEAGSQNVLRFTEEEVMPKWINLFNSLVNEK